MTKSIILFCCIILASCKNKLSGKIEKRGSNTVYVVNTSTTKVFRFTLKTTTTTNDSTVAYTTRSIELGPGDEVQVGNTKAVSATAYPDIAIAVFRAYFIGSGSTMRPADTIMNGRSVERFYIFTDNEKEGEIENIFIKANARLFKKEKEKMKDTMLYGKMVKYAFSEEKRKDLSHPYPVQKFAYRYEVTGQLEISSKDYLKTKP